MEFIRFGGMFSSFKQGKKPHSGRSTKWHQRLVDVHNRNPCCHYCGIETLLENRMDEWNSHLPNAATLDHVFSNYDIRRLLKGGRDLVVLSCYKCNNKRSSRETKLVYSNTYDKRNNKISLIQLLKNNLSQ